MFKALRLPLDWVEACLAFALGLTAIAILVAIYFAIRAFVGHAYRYVAPMAKIRTWREEARTQGFAVDHIDTGTVQAICDQYLEAVATNDAANDLKSAYVHRASQVVVFALVLAIASSVPWIGIELYESGNRPPNVETRHGS